MNWLDSTFFRGLTTHRTYWSDEYEEEAEIVLSILYGHDSCRSSKSTRSRIEQNDSGKKWQFWMWTKSLILSLERTFSWYFDIFQWCGSFVLFFRFQKKQMNSFLRRIELVFPSLFKMDVQSNVPFVLLVLLGENRRYSLGYSSADSSSRISWRARSCSHRNSIGGWGCGHSEHYPEKTKLPFLLKVILQKQNSPCSPQFFGTTIFLQKSFWCVWKSKICDHLHLSVQSGSPSILRKMNQGHGTEEVFSAVEMARQKDQMLPLPGILLQDFQPNRRHDF